MLNDLIIAITLLVLSAALYCFMLAKLKSRASYFRNVILLPAAAISGFVLYYIGFATVPEPDSVGVTAFRAIHATVMMILMESTIGDISDVMRNDRFYMVLFATSHFLGILFTVTTALSLFGRRINAKLRILTSFNKSCYIFFNINEESITLAEDILRSDSSRDIFFVGEQVEKDESELFDRIEGIGAYYIDNSDSKNGVGGSLLFRHFINRTSRLIYISPDENRNISAVLHLFSLLKELPAAQREAASANISVYLQIDSEDMNEIFQEARRDMDVTIEYSIFSVPEVIATELILNYSPTKYVAIDSSKGVATEDYEVMIVGFGRNGDSALRRIIEYGQFVGSAFHATIVDRAINSKIGSFNTNYPGIMEHYSIETAAMDVSSLAFFELLRSKSKSLKQIVISLSSDALNVKTAIEVNKLLSTIECGHIDIVIVTRQNNNYLYLHKSDDFDSVHCIGQNRDIFTEAIVINESLRQRAKSTHDHYNSTKAPERRKPWSSLESIKRESNIAASFHISTKLALLGLTVEQVRAMSSEEYVAYLRSDTMRYENLARTEHLRWNATYFSRGWRCWSIAELPNNSVSQDHCRKLHVCLVTWEGLVAVEDFFDGEPYQRYDYDNIDAMYDLVLSGLAENF